MIISHFEVIRSPYKITLTCFSGDQKISETEFFDESELKETIKLILKGGK